MAADELLPLRRRRRRVRMPLRWLHVTLCAICAYMWMCCALVVTTDAAADDAPQTLDALVADFHAGLQRAASERETIQKRMESTREQIRGLFVSEREETQLYAVEMRLKMNAMRDGMRAEMDNMVREFQQQIVYAAQNVSALAKRRENVKRESEQRLQELKQKQEDMRRQRQHVQDGDGDAMLSSVVDDEKSITEPVKNDINIGSDAEPSGDLTADTPTAWQRTYEACQIAQTHASQTSSRVATTVGRWLKQAGSTLIDWPMRIGAAVFGWMEMLWSMFFATIVGIVTTVWQLCLRLLMPVAIVMGVLLLFIICVAIYKVWQRAKRKQRVLYSEYLKPPRRRSKNDKVARTTRQVHVVVQQRSQRRVSVSTGDASSSTSSSLSQSSTTT
ncbi:hypothetical protein FI667_g285, partial [Globisporangium splendens]